MLALPTQELIIPAAVLLRVLAADRRAVFIDGAAPLVLVQHLAGAFEDMILAVAQDVAVAFDMFREFLLGLLIIEVEAFPQPLDVAPGHRDPIIAAAISRTFRTVVSQFRLFWFSVGL